MSFCVLEAGASEGSGGRGYSEDVLLYGSTQLEPPWPG